MAVAFTQLTVAEVEPTASARVAWGTVLGREEGWSLSPLRSHLEPTDQNPLPPVALQSRFPLALGWEIPGPAPLTDSILFLEPPSFSLCSLSQHSEAQTVSVPILPGTSTWGATDVSVHS